MADLTSFVSLVSSNSQVRQIFCSQPFRSLLPFISAATISGNIAFNGLLPCMSIECRYCHSFANIIYCANRSGFSAPHKSNLIGSWVDKSVGQAGWIIYIVRCSQQSCVLITHRSSSHNVPEGSHQLEPLIPGYIFHPASHLCSPSYRPWTNNGIVTGHCATSCLFRIRHCRILDRGSIACPNLESRSSASPGICSVTPLSSGA